MNNHIEKIKSGATTAFIDSTNKSSSAYKPEFISNDHTNGVKVLTSIEDELRRCDSFIFSVAFITLGGITPMLQTLQELEKKGIPGRILTTDYNNFTDPKALDKLASFKNIELRMYQVQGGENIGFHTKGYIFKKDETYTFIIGSANMTDRALAVNKEWNTKLVSTEEGEMYKNITTEFNKLWSDANHTKSYDEFIDEYRIRYETIKKQKKIALEYAKKSEEDNADNDSQIVSLEQYKLSPNKMQIGFINNLKTLVEQGENKALLISATGTGKTYASAFGLRDAMGDSAIALKGNYEKTDRILFIVHREQIAKQAMKSYKNVFGRSKTYGLLSGNSKETDADILFATMQMMSKEEVMTQFPKDCFKTIVIEPERQAIKRLWTTLSRNSGLV